MEQRAATGRSAEPRQQGCIPKPVKTISIDDPRRGIETRIIIFYVEPDYAGQVYRRKDVSDPWEAVHTTLYTGEINAEQLARRWHRKHPAVMVMP